MDLNTGEKREIRGESGKYVRVLGFVGSDLVYGTANKEDVWMDNGRVRELPMESIRIINDQMQEETSYEKPGYYSSRRYKIAHCKALLSNYRKHNRSLP